jgi:hypothetical protein
MGQSKAIGIFGFMGSLFFARVYHREAIHLNIYRVVEISESQMVLGNGGSEKSWQILIDMSETIQIKAASSCSARWYLKLLPWDSLFQNSETIRRMSHFILMPLLVQQLVDKYVSFSFHSRVRFFVASCGCAFILIRLKLPREEPHLTTPNSSQSVFFVASESHSSQFNFSPLIFLLRSNFPCFNIPPVFPFSRKLQSNPPISYHFPIFNALFRVRSHVILGGVWREINQILRSSGRHGVESERQAARKCNRLVCDEVWSETVAARNPRSINEGSRKGIMRAVAGV